jgi:methylated-DNA-[protein]-cysteine S-methyltransferase
MALTEQDGALVALDFAAAGANDSSPLLRRAAEELAEYFAGKRKTFTVPLRPKGSDFQLRAWAALSAIPYGEVRTYSAVAHALGSGPRAIGQACRSNPLPVFIPCHRVVAVNGLGGFSGAANALDRKRALLAIEGRA